MAEIITGGTPPKHNLAFYGGDVPFYKPSDLNKGYKISVAADTLTAKGLAAARFLPADSVLVTCIGSIGKAALIKVAGSCNQQINAIIPSPVFIPSYVLYAVLSP